VSETNNTCHPEQAPEGMWTRFSLPWPSMDIPAEQGDDIGQKRGESNSSRLLLQQHYLNCIINKLGLGVPVICQYDMLTLLPHHVLSAYPLLSHVSFQNIKTKGQQLPRR
jgi:hypothetical protein